MIMNMKIPLVMGALLVLVVFEVLFFPPYHDDTHYCPETSDASHCHKVIIIGAGMAGLGAAKELQSHGYDDFIIFEFQGLPGGRVDTANASNQNIKYNFDTHASFISGYKGNPIYTLAQLYNETDENLKGTILLKVTDYNNAVTFDDGKRVPKKTMDKWYGVYTNNFTSWMESKRESVKADQPLQNTIDEFRKNNLTNANDRKYFAYEIGNYVGNEYADDPSKMSLLYWNKIGYKPGGDNATDEVFPNGFYSIPKGLADSVGLVHIKYKTEVVQVNYTDHGVIVRTSRYAENNTKIHEVYYGKYVISTIPIWKLQDGGYAKLFHPPIPDDKSVAIDKMRVGTLGQSYFYFNKGVFWDDVDWLNYVPPENETGHFSTFENMYRVNKVPMLFVYNYGAYAIELINGKNATSGDHIDIKKELMKALIHMYPDKFSNYTNKDDDPFLKSIDVKYKGEIESYSSIPVGFVVPYDFNLISSPLVDENGKNRVFFAGEATTWHYPQTTHGAYLTGLREANRLMVTDMGKYPDPSFQENDWRYPKNINKNSTWLTYPEYIICPPNLELVLENNSAHTPICQNEHTVAYLYENNAILNPKQADPASK